MRGQHRQLHQLPLGTLWTLRASVHSVQWQLASSPGIPFPALRPQAPGVPQPFPPPLIPGPQFTRPPPPLCPQLWELLTPAQEEEECEETPPRQVPSLPRGLLSLPPPHPCHDQGCADPVLRPPQACSREHFYGPTGLILGPGGRDGTGEWRPLEAGQEDVDGGQCPPAGTKEAMMGGVLPGSRPAPSSHSRDSSPEPDRGLEGGGRRKANCNPCLPHESALPWGPQEFPDNTVYWSSVQGVQPWRCQSGRQKHQDPKLAGKGHDRQKDVELGSLNG